MHVESVTLSELRVTLETLVGLVNTIDHDTNADDAEPPRQILANNGFSRAKEASEASVQRLGRRIEELAPFVRAMAECSVEEAAARVSEELTEIPITPSIVDHGGIGPHIHWTPTTARFDDQVMADLLMALAQELCDNGTIRFGRCAADSCDRMYYDATRNRSKRFCSDPRCASRTHTADHRARQRGE